MNEYATALVREYSPRGLLVDANVLLLYFIGSYDRSLITRYKRTRVFEERDYDTVLAFFGAFARLVTMPNILTEVSNLSTALADSIRPAYLRRFAAALGPFTEEYAPSQDTVRLPIFTRLALTDAGIEQVARDTYLVLTDDLDLYRHLERSGIAVLNFNHIRDLAWQ